MSLTYPVTIVGEPLAGPTSNSDHARVPGGGLRSSRERRRGGFTTRSSSPRDHLCRVVRNSPDASPPSLSAVAFQKGDRVLLWGDNGAPWIAAFFGCVLRGVVAVPIDAGGSTDFAEKVLRDVQPRLVAVPKITSPRSTRNVRKFAFEDFEAMLPERGDTTPAADLSEQRHSSDHLHFRHHRRAEGHRPHSSQRPGQPAAH